MSALQKAKSLIFHNTGVTLGVTRYRSVTAIVTAKSAADQWLIRNVTARAGFAGSRRAGARVRTQNMRYRVTFLSLFHF